VSEHLRILGDLRTFSQRSSTPLKKRSPAASDRTQKRTTKRRDPKVSARGADETSRNPGVVRRLVGVDND